MAGDANAPSSRGAVSVWQPGPRAHLAQQNDQLMSEHCALGFLLAPKFCASQHYYVAMQFNICCTAAKVMTAAQDEIAMTRFPARLHRKRN
jgi:hypothetical protein